MGRGGEKPWWWNHSLTGSGYQGKCFRCGKVGHKTSECTKRLQEVAGEDGEKGEKEGFVDEAALEVDKSWSLGCVDSCCAKIGVGEVRRKKDKK